MQKTVRYIAILFLVVCCFQTKGQAPLLDSLKAQRERFEYPFIIIPAHYVSLSQKFNLSNIKSTDSFSLRLWTNSMFGYTLSTFEKKNIFWESHSYYYYSDTSIKEIKLHPKISTMEFLHQLKTFNFDNFISQYQIQDFKDNVDDGTWYTLEVIRGEHYKVFQYHNPELFKDGQNKEFATVINLLEKYFYKSY